MQNQSLIIGYHTNFAQHCTKLELCHEFGINIIRLVSQMMHIPLKIHELQNGTTDGLVSALLDDVINVTPPTLAPTSERMEQNIDFIPVKMRHMKLSFVFNEKAMTKKRSFRWYAVFSPVAWILLLMGFACELWFPPKFRITRLQLCSMFFCVVGFLKFLYGTFVLNSLLRHKVLPFDTIQDAFEPVVSGEYRVFTLGNSATSDLVSHYFEEINFWNANILIHSVFSDESACQALSENHKNFLLISLVMARRLAKLCEIDVVIPPNSLSYYPDFATSLTPKSFPLKINLTHAFNTLLSMGIPQEMFKFEGWVVSYVEPKSSHTPLALSDIFSLFIGYVTVTVCIVLVVRLMCKG